MGWTFVLLLIQASVFVIAGLILLGSVVDFMAIARTGDVAAGVSIALKASVLIWFILVVVPGGMIGRRLGYMMPLPVFGLGAIPLTGAFVTLDLRLARRWHRWRRPA